jgi:hypothetical protein
MMSNYKKHAMVEFRVAGWTDEEINSIPDCEYMDFYKAINAKLKNKNV